MKIVYTSALRCRSAVPCLVTLLTATGLMASGVHVTNLGDYGGGKSFASFINNEGDVTGYSYLDSSTYHAYFYSGTTFTLNDIGTFGGTLSQPKGLNAYGDVSGTADLVDLVSGNTFVPNAFIYHNGTLTSLGTLGGTNSFGNGINDYGTVVGSGFYSSNTKSGAIMSSTPWNPPPLVLGTALQQGTLGGSFGDADFINNNGQIAGNANLTGDHSTQAFYSQDGSSLVQLSLGGTNSTATGINSLGQVIGKSAFSAGVTQHGFVYTPGMASPQDLNTLIFNGTNYVGASDAEAINSLGQVVGESDYANGNSVVQSGHHHAYSANFANSTWTMTDLGTLTGYSDSVATAINNEGEIVGTAGTGSSTAAFLYLNGQMIDLTSLLPANSGFTQLLTATGINDQGVIIGQGLTTSGSKDAYIFSYSAFIVPEPSEVVPVLLALLFAAVRFHGQRATRKC